MTRSGRPCASNRQSEPLPGFDRAADEAGPGAERPPEVRFEFVSDGPDGLVRTDGDRVHVLAREIVEDRGAAGRDDSVEQALAARARVDGALFVDGERND